MPSELAKHLSPFYVMEVLERAKRFEREGKDIIHFEVGEPDFPTHDDICSAAVESIRKGETKYTESTGISELRGAIVSSYNDTYRQDVSPESVIVTLGSSPALFLSIASLINPGDEIIITDPHYSCYPQIIKVAGGMPRKVRVYEENGFQVEISDIRRRSPKRQKPSL